MTDQEFLTQLKAELEKIRVPVGAIMPYRGTTAPDGWLVVNGQNVYESVYPDLYNFLKVQPNAKTGTDSTGAFVKCELPHHRVIELTTTVSEVGQLVEAGLPDIAGNAVLSLEQITDCHVLKSEGALFGDFDGRPQHMQNPNFQERYSSSPNRLNIKASRSNALFRGNTLQTNALRLLAIIKI